MTVPTVACTNCGKPFTTDDLRGTNCKYCGTLLAHHARAQQQVAVINQMMADRNGNGIPDMYEGIVANAQANALNQAFGVQPYNPYAAPPNIANNPYAANNLYAANMQVAQTVTKTVSTITIIVVAFVAVMMLGGIAVGFLVFFAAR